MKNILITGARGFVGKNLKEAFENKYNIFAPTHQELELLDFDALKLYVQENKIDIIIHAAIHVPMFNGVQKEFFNDMQMFFNIEKLSTQVEKVIYFGSGAEFDKRYDIRMVAEEDLGKTIPASEYGLAKYTMTRLAQNSKNIYNLRLFGIFGKYELWDIKFLSNLCCKALCDVPLTVRSDCYFDFLYIEDLPQIVEWFITNTPIYHDYNVCYGKHYLLTELAEMVIKASGKDIKYTLLSNNRNLDYSASNKRLLLETGIKLTPIQTAIEDLYKYYSENFQQVDIEKLKMTK